MNKSGRLSNGEWVMIIATIIIVIILTIGLFWK